MSMRFFHGSMGTCGDIMIGLSSSTCHRFEELLTTLAEVYNILQVVHLLKDDQLEFWLS